MAIHAGSTAPRPQATPAAPVAGNLIEKVLPQIVAVLAGPLSAQGTWLPPFQTLRYDGHRAIVWDAHPIRLTITLASWVRRQSRENHRLWLIRVLLRITTRFSVCCAADAYPLTPTSADKLGNTL